VLIYPERDQRAPSVSADGQQRGTAQSRPQRPPHAVSRGPHAGCSIASPNREFTPELSNPLSACWQNSWRVSVHAGRRRVHYPAGIHRAAAVGLVAKSITLSGAREKIAAAAFAPLQPRTDSEVILPAAMAGGDTGLVLCQVSGQ
jgi:hypothetical protein